MSAAVAELLRAGRERIVRGWTSESFAVDALGTVVAESGPEAVAWCALGALSAEWLAYVSDGEAALAVLAAQTPYGYARTSSGLDQWERLPTTTQADVLALFDRAIAAAEAQS